MKINTIGFIGFGNMAQAMVKGMLLKQTAAPSQIYACAKNWDKLQKTAAGYGIHACRTAAEVAAAADLILVAVKPYLVEEVLTPIKDLLADKALVSVAVNFPFAKYETFLKPGTHHMSTLPNTPIAVGEGVIMCEQQHSLNEEELEAFHRFFGPAALIKEIDTAHLGIAGTISGCGPALTAMYIEALADAAVLHGLPRALAYQIASQTIVGTGKLQLESGDHPGVMKDAVCSPGGTTIVGVTTLERKGFRAAVIDSIDAIMKK